MTDRSTITIDELRRRIWDRIALTRAFEQKPFTPAAGRIAEVRLEELQWVLKQMTREE